MSAKKVWFITGAGRGMGVDSSPEPKPWPTAEQVVADLKAQTRFGASSKSLSELVELAGIEPATS